MRALLVLLVVSETASATTRSVGAAQPFLTIQDALAAASPGDIIAVEGGVYTGPIVVDIEVEVVGLAGSAGTSIFSATQDPAVTLSGGDLYGFDVLGMFDTGVLVADGFSATVDDLRIAGMNAGASAMHVGVGSTLILRNAELDGNVDSLGLGGHVYVADEGILEVRSASFTGGMAARGGAIFAEPTATVTIYDGLFEGNTAVQGGHLVGVQACFGSVFRNGIATDVGGAGQDSCLVSARNLFEGNNAGGDGGALHFTGGHGVWISETAFVDNSSGGDGGAVRMGNDLDPNPAVAKSYFCGNSATGLGGGIYSHFWSDVAGLQTLGSMSVQNTVFAANSPSAITHSSQHFDGTAGGPVNASYNTFVDNPSGGLDQFLSELPEVIGNIFAGHGAAFTDRSPYRFDNGLQHDNLWFDNSNDAVSDYLPSVSAVFADPEFAGWSDDADCWNDDFRLTLGSPGIDAGDPSDLDPDGSLADLGAHGGPSASTESLSDFFGNLDPGPNPTLRVVPGLPDVEDGADVPEDVDDDADPADPAEDPGTDPESAEQRSSFDRDDPCPGVENIDSDGDGVLSCEDCDDSDPRVQECAPDGLVERHSSFKGGSGCGCSNTKTGSLAWVLLPLLWIRRQTRISAHRTLATAS